MASFAAARSPADVVGAEVPTARPSHQVGESGKAQSAKGFWAPVSLEDDGHRLRVPGPERLVVGRAQQVQHGVDALVTRMALAHEPRPAPHRPLERIGRAETTHLDQPFGMQKRHPGQDEGVQAVVLRVLLVVPPQIR